MTTNTCDTFNEKSLTISFISKCKCSAYFSALKPPYQSLFNVFSLETVDDRIDCSRYEAVHHGDNNTSVCAKCESQIVGEIDETSRHIIKAGDKDLRSTGGQDFVLPIRRRHFQNRYDYGKVRKDDECQRTQET